MAYAANSILFEAISNIVCQKSEKIFQKHTEDEQLWKTFSKFMVLRYLTMSYDSRVQRLIIDNYFLLEKMPDKELYRWLLRNVPKQKNGFIRYIK